MEGRKMADLISRAEAIKKFTEKREVWYGNGPLPSIESLMWQAAMSITEELPAVDAAPVVHARWIEIEDSCGDCHYQCTGCGEEWNLNAGTPAENNMNYCPNCGAKMDKNGKEKQV